MTFSCTLQNLEKVKSSPPLLCLEPIHLGPEPRTCCQYKKEKDHITLLSFRESPLFLCELQNRAKHLPQLLKPFTLPPGLVISGFEGDFFFSFFIYFG